MSKPITYSLFIFAFLFLVGCGSAEPASIEHGAVVPTETVQGIEKPAEGLSADGSVLYTTTDGAGVFQLGTP